MQASQASLDLQRSVRTGTVPVRDVGLLQRCFSCIRGQLTLQGWKRALDLIPGKRAFGK